MRCLGIPVDHRLRNFINNKSGIVGAKPSGHIRMLKDYGESVRVEALPGDVATELSVEELDFALELARPETTGGVVIILYHPDPSQTYESGYTSEESRCATLASIRDLVLCTTLGSLDSDAVTILDSMPFLVEDFNEKDESHVMAQEKFLEILVAKQPSVVLSCFSSGTKSKPLELIRHWGVGTEADRPIYVPGKNLEFDKINGIHPGYAINHHPHESRFRQLLTLQFAKAFGTWRSDWIEQPFMREIRQDSASLASRYRDCNPENLSQLKQTRFKETLEALTKALYSLGHFKNLRGLNSAAIRKNLIQSRLTWLLCDCGLFLDEESKLKELLDHQHLRQNAETWLAAVLGEGSGDSTDSVGLKDHRTLLDKESTLLDHHARQLQNLFFTWLRQVNLGFTRTDKSGYHHHDLELHSNAMLRFACGIEDVLAREDLKNCAEASLVQDLQGLKLV
jgi:hypothetical protein